MSSSSASKRWFHTASYSTPSPSACVQHGDYRVGPLAAQLFGLFAGNKSQRQHVGLRRAAVKPTLSRVRWTPKSMGMVSTSRTDWIVRALEPNQRRGNVAGQKLLQRGPAVACKDAVPGAGCNNGWSLWSEGGTSATRLSSLKVLRYVPAGFSRQAPGQAAGTPMD